MKVVKSLDIVNDYIEKLEQENKQLKEQINEYQKAVGETTSEKIDLQQENIQLKEAIKKANEFIKKHSIIKNIRGER